MSNMSYCRFENTLLDLRDCRDALISIDGDLDQLSDTEKRAAQRLIDVCRDIANDFGERDD